MSKPFWKRYWDELSRVQPRESGYIQLWMATACILIGWFFGCEYQDGKHLENYERFEALRSLELAMKELRVRCPAEEHYITFTLMNQDHFLEENAKLIEKQLGLTNSQAHIYLIAYRSNKGVVSPERLQMIRNMPSFTSDWDKLMHDIRGLFGD